MREGLGSPTCYGCVMVWVGWEEERLGGFVGAEEEGRAGGGTDEGGAHAPVDAAETAGREEALVGLEAGFEGVEGEERGVDCCAG